MRQIVIKGDDYELEGDEFTDSYNDPAKKIKPPSGVYDPLVAITKMTTPDTGEEFVFCSGKPVVVSGYVFSQLKRDIYKREWPPEEENSGAAGGKSSSGKGKDDYKDEKKDSDTLDITAIGTCDHVFIDGVPVCIKEEGVSASGKKKAVIDGKVEEVGEISGEGKFIQNDGHAYCVP